MGPTSGTYFRLIDPGKSGPSFHCLSGHPIMETCPGCGAAYSPLDGPTHAYMLSSAACFAAFNQLLAEEFSNAALMSIHRLTVDTWAVQHPGLQDDRRAVQSVGLHLARLYMQLEHPRPPKETNAVMLDFARHKKTLVPLTPAGTFRITARDVAPFAGTAHHIPKVREWAEATWEDWSDHHETVRTWVSQNSKYLAK